jgi:UDP-2-acetamido-3-amino-2,3-dideoxy-glucuronate N-acetyltransferase
MAERRSRRAPVAASAGELGVGVVGLGRWGKKLLRVFSAAPRARVVAACDPDPRGLREAQRSHPELELFSDFDLVIRRPDLDAVVLATPSTTHAALVLRALEAGKHVFVEKPMATCLGDALAIRAAAQATGKRVMVGHVLEYHPALRQLRALVRSGALGEVRLVYSERFGLVAENTTDPWWELAPHDFSLLRLITDRDPEQIAARRQGDAIEARVVLKTGIRARIDVGRCDHRAKKRSFLVVGKKGIAVFNGLALGGQLDVMFPRAGAAMSMEELVECWTRTDPELELAADAGFSRTLLAGTSAEPLAIEAAHFVAAVLDVTEIATDSENGLRVVAALDAGERSMREGGAPIAVQAYPALRRILAAPSQESVV